MSSAQKSYRSGDIREIEEMSSLTVDPGRISPKGLGSGEDLSSHSYLILLPAWCSLTLLEAIILCAEFKSVRILVTCMLIGTELWKIICYHVSLCK